MSKVCKGCGVDKPRTLFGVVGKLKNGEPKLNPRCKECHAAKQRERYSANAEEIKADRRQRYAENVETERERVRAYGAAHKEERHAYWAAWYAENGAARNERKREHRARVARVRASQRRYYWRNRDARIAQSAAWREANRERLTAYYKADAQNRKEYQREWRQANPERIRAYRQRWKPQAHDYLTEWRRTHPVRPDETAQESPLQAR